MLLGTVPRSHKPPFGLSGTNHREGLKKEDKREWEEDLVGDSEDKSVISVEMKRKTFL